MAKTTEERFWSKVKKTRSCWLWTGAGVRYGGFGVEGKVVQTHRYSWELHNGPIPDGLFVLHSCDNVKCVKPAHLFLGTNADNVQDKVNKGREARGEKIGSSKLTWKEVRAIRKYYKSKHGGSKTHQQIADHFGIDQSAISRIISNKSWRE